VPVRLRPLLLPAEHGAWSFVLEPIALGLLVAPTRAGALLGLAALAIFIARQPLKLGLADRASGRSYPRTFVALRLASAALVAAILLGALAWSSTPYAWWAPVTAALPFAAVQLAYDVQREGRGLVAELAGPIAAAASAPAIAAAAGWRPAAWLALWALMVARSLPAALYVRARLRLERGELVRPTPAAAAHAVALALALILSAYGLAPRPAGVAFTLLLVRAAWGLSGRRRPATPQQIGISEVLLGAAFVVFIGAGYWRM
jgi:YwiC-like protein